MYKVGFKILILVCIAVPITIFILQVDFKIVLEELRRIGVGFGLILLVTFVAYLLGTIGWWICLGSERTRISLWQLFGIRQIGETVGLYNPSSIVGGDMLKNELLKPHGLSNSGASTSVVVSRVAAVLSQLLLLMLYLCWWAATEINLLTPFWLGGLFILIALLLLVKIGFFYLLLRYRSPSVATKQTSTNLWQRFRSAIYQLIGQTQIFFQQHRNLFWWCYGFFFLHWLVGGLEFYIILRYLNYPVQLMQSIGMDMGVVFFKSLGAFVPGQVGVEELGNKVMLSSISIHAASIWATVSILRRARQLFWILVGVVCYVFVRKTDTLKVFRHGNTVRQP